MNKSLFIPMPKKASKYNGRKRMSTAVKWAALADLITIVFGTTLVTAMLVADPTTDKEYTQAIQEVYKDLPENELIGEVIDEIYQVIRSKAIFSCAVTAFGMTGLLADLFMLLSTDMGRRLDDASGKARMSAVVNITMILVMLCEMCAFGIWIMGMSVLCWRAAILLVVLRFKGELDDLTKDIQIYFGTFILNYEKSIRGLEGDDKVAGKEMGFGNGVGNGVGARKKQNRSPGLVCTAVYEINRVI